MRLAAVATDTSGEQVSLKGENLGCSHSGDTVEPILGRFLTKTVFYPCNHRRAIGNLGRLFIKGCNHPRRTEVEPVHLPSVDFRPHGQMHAYDVYISELLSGQAYLFGNDFIWANHGLVP